jgi:hypothetical protein
VRLKLALAACCAVLLGLAALAGPAHADPDDVDFSIAVEDGDCSTATTDAKCSASTSAPFTVQVSIDSFATQKLGYQSIQVNLANSAGLLSKITHPTQLPPTIVWPDCAGNSSLSMSTTNYQAVCTSPGASTFEGVVVEVDFNCTTPGTHTMTLEQPSDGTKTHIVSNKGTTAVDPDGNETLTINCATLVGGAQADLAAPAASSNASGAIAGASAAAFVALTGVAWNFRRRAP